MGVSGDDRKGSHVEKETLFGLPELRLGWVVVGECWAMSSTRRPAINPMGTALTAWAAPRVEAMSRQDVGFALAIVCSRQSGLPLHTGGAAVGVPLPWRLHLPWQAWRGSLRPVAGRRRCSRLL